MPRLPRRTCVACCVTLLLACSDKQPAAPEVVDVQPSSISAAERSRIRILGRSFSPLVYANFDDQQQSQVSFAFVAQLGDHALEDVSFVSTTELAATVPAGLPPGTYDVVVIDPRAQRGALPAALTLLGPAGDGGPSEASVGPNDARPPLLDGGVADAATDAPPADGGADLALDSATDLAIDVGVDVGADVGVDLSLPPDSGSGCPVVCTTGCAGNVCELDCDDGCTCPAGMDCRVSCGTAGACVGTIDCTDARDCDVKCSGSTSCSGIIDCTGTDECEVSCSGNASCAQTIECVGAGECEVQCSTSACLGNPVCRGSACQIL